MTLKSAIFKAKLVEYPIQKDEKTGESKKCGIFTIGKKYRILAVWDDLNGTRPSEFLVAADNGEFWWLPMGYFRSK